MNKFLKCTAALFVLLTATEAFARGAAAEHHELARLSAAPAGVPGLCPEPVGLGSLDAAGAR